MKRSWFNASSLTACSLLMALILMGSSCGKRNSGPRVLVPEGDTAKEQYLIAEQQLNDARSVFDKSSREQEMIKAIKAYEKVEERFPQDEKYTPVAALLVAQIYRDLERFDTAISEYEHVLKTYPNDKDVQLSGLYGMGLSLNESNRPAEALVYFKQVMDEYGTSSDPRVREVVEESRRLYRQVRLLE